MAAAGRPDIIRNETIKEEMARIVALVESRGDGFDQTSRLVEHYRFIIEEPPQDPEQALRLHNEIWDLAVKISLECGGIINEHHGVGLKLARHVRRQYGSAFQVLEVLKNGLDPYHVMNPGKMGFGPTI